MTDKLVKELENQLKLKDFKLNSLLEITNAINLNQGVDQLMRIYEFILKEQLGFGRFVLFNLQEDWNCLSKVGIKGKLKEIDIKNDLGRFKEITVIESSQSSLLSEFDIIVPIFHKETPLAYLLIAGIQKEGNKITDSLSFMSFVKTLTNIIVVAIENKRMTRQSLIQERIKKELEVASEMQKLLFPADLPSNRRMDI